MKETFGSSFKKYFDGDPEAIAVMDLPAIIVEQTGDTTNEGAYGQDDVQDRIVVKVVLNKRDDFTGDAVDPLNLTARKIRELVGKRDSATNDYDDQTVKGAIRKHLTDDITALAPEMTVEYGINPRIGGEGLANLTAEGHVTFSLEYSLNTDQ